MTSLIRCSLALVALAAVMATVPALASARTNIAVGIGDQNASMFESPAYKKLKLRKTRYLIAWNAASDPGRLAGADAYVKAARRANVRVLMHITDPDTARRSGKLPSVKQYRSNVRKLVQRYKAMGVREWGVWNEANHDSQPTFNNPARAADYFKQMRSICKGCTIVALDLLDQKGVAKYVSRFYKRLGSAKKFAKVVGIHNYSDTNRKRSSGTKAILDATKKADNVKTAFWLTETGGIVSFASFKCSEKRAANRTQYMFTLAKKFRRDVKRLYAYNWQGVDCRDRFDAGFVRLDGSTRPAYDTFRKNLRDFER